MKRKDITLGQRIHLQIIGRSMAQTCFQPLRTGSARRLRPPHVTYLFVLIAFISYIALKVSAAFATEFREVILAYMAAMERLARTVLNAIAGVCDVTSY